MFYIDYGKEQADVMMYIIGNTVSGQVTGDTQNSSVNESYHSVIVK